MQSATAHKDTGAVKLKIKKNCRF